MYKRIPTQIVFLNSLFFPCFSLSNHKFSLRQFMYFVTITYTKLTPPAHPKNWKFSGQISKYLLPLESGNLQLEQIKFPVFWQNFQIPCVFPDRDFLGSFSLFSLSSLWSWYPGINLPCSCHAGSHLTFSHMPPKERAQFSV